MKLNDFKAFSLLIADIYQKAFDEELTELQQGKSQPLSYYIYEATGRMVSYKSLGNYLKAVCHQTPDRINPSVETLAILIHYVTAPNDLKPVKLPAAVVWINYKKAILSLYSAS